MRDDTSYCPFCNHDYGRKVILENDNVYSIYDKFPVSKGHVLIVPKRHCSSYFELTDKEQECCWQMVNELRKFLSDRFHPGGFSIGVNVNEEAGQTVSHAYIHLIPRYAGDVKEPEGGVRGVIPEKRIYNASAIHKNQPK